MNWLEKLINWINYGSRRALYGVGFASILATCAFKLHTLHMQNQVALQQPIISKIWKLEKEINSTVEIQLKKIDDLWNKQRLYASNAEKLLSEEKVDEAIQQYKKELEALESLLSEISAISVEKHLIEIQKLEAHPSIWPEIKQGFAEVAETYRTSLLPRHEQNKNQIIRLIADKKAQIRKLQS